MKNLFDQGVAEEIRERIMRLNTDSKPRWGKMNVAEMMAHCVRPMEMALGEIEMPKAGFLKRIMGLMIKQVIISPKPYKHSLPTNEAFVTLSTQQDFEEAKQKLVSKLEHYLSMQDQVEHIAHPLYGKLTKKQCGTSQYKHLDHHLTQFGA